MVVYVPLGGVASDRLRHLAREQKRRPQDQAAHILELALRQSEGDDVLLRAALGFPVYDAEAAVAEAKAQAEKYAAERNAQTRRHQK